MFLKSLRWVPEIHIESTEYIWKTCLYWSLPWLLSGRIPCVNIFRSLGFPDSLEKPLSARHQWLTPVILATQETEIRRIAVRSQLGQIVPKTLPQKKKKEKHCKKGW
jgi:hypothetical protein